MGVTEYREVFAGKNPAEVAQLAGEFSKLKDPVDKAAFAVQHFGDQADAALPLLGDRLKSSADRAYEFSSAMASKPREALEQLAVTLHRPAEALHALGDEFRALKLEMREGIAIKVAWVVQSWEEAQRASETARKQITARGGDPNAGTVTMGGINWGAITEKPQMSYLQVAQSLVGASSEALEKFRPTGMVGGGPSSQLVAKSQAAIDRYGATAEGLSRRLSEVQGKLRDHQDQLVRASNYPPTDCAGRNTGIHSQATGGSCATPRVIRQGKAQTHPGRRRFHHGWGQHHPPGCDQQSKPDFRGAAKSLPRRESI
jgi:hypothetical protein